MVNPDPLTFASLRKGNQRRLAAFPTCHDWTAVDWACALAGEAGEAANIAKKIRRGDLTLDEARESLAKELADVVTYADLLAASEHIGHIPGTVAYLQFDRSPPPETTLTGDALWLMSCAGDVAENARHGGSVYELTKAIRELVYAVGTMANVAAIDLGKAVRQKFDEVSARVGWTEVLE